MKYDIIDDELKRLTNRCIGKLLEALGNSINDAQITVIKSQVRLFEGNIRKNILSTGQSNGTTTK